MDINSRPEDGLENPGRNEPAVPNEEAAIQTALDNLQYLKEKEFHENASTFNFDGSAGAREATPSTINRYDNIFSSVQSQGLQFSPSVEDPRCFNTLNASRNHPDPYGTALNSSHPAHYWNNSASNYVFNNETYADDTKYKPEIRGKFVEDLLTESKRNINYDGILEMNASSMIAFPNRTEAGNDGKQIESNYNLAHIAQNNSEPCHIPEGVASNSSYYSVQDVAASGSSGCHTEVNTSNVVGKTLQSSDISDIRSTKYEEIKSLLCRICADEISQHETDKNVLISIDSLYNNRNGTNLLFHRSTHVPKTSCNICGKEHAVENSHESEHICPYPECKKTFLCRTLFYRHIPGHRQYFKKHCWVCRRKFSEHITNQDSIYKCCVCGVLCNQHYNLEIHCIIHLPPCFCNLCKEEYHVYDENFHSHEVKCCFCRNSFQCRIKYEEHFEVHVKDFSELHRVRKSNEKLNEKPLILWNFQGASEVCTEFDYKNRLYSYAGLILFECEHCGRHFPEKKSATTHSYSCKALPYKCEICETRFHTIDLLHSHGLVKHAG